MTDQHTPVRGRFDMGAAYEALAFDYTRYPLVDRRRMLLQHLEACIEPGPPAPIPALDDHTARVLHVTMAGWLVLAAVLGLILAPQLWWLEVLSVGLGGYAAVRYFRTPHHRKEPR